MKSKKHVARGDEFAFAQSMLTLRGETAVQEQPEKPAVKPDKTKMFAGMFDDLPLPA